MTDAQRPDVAAVVADALAISARYEWGPSWPDKAEQWITDLIDNDKRLAELARAVGATVPPQPGRRTDLEPEPLTHELEVLSPAAPRA